MNHRINVKPDTKISRESIGQTLGDLEVCKDFLDVIQNKFHVSKI